MTEHGYSAYSNGYCRCDVCKAAKAAYAREHRAALRRGRDFRRAVQELADRFSPDYESEDGPIVPGQRQGGHALVTDAESHPRPLG